MRTNHECGNNPGHILFFFFFFFMKFRYFTENTKTKNIKNFFCSVFTCSVHLGKFVINNSQTHYLVCLACSTRFQENLSTKLFLKSPEDV